MSGFHGKQRPKKSNRSYEPGAKIDSLIEFILRLEQRLPFYYRGRFMAAGFIEHWSFVQVRSAIRYNNLYCAEKIKENQNG